MIVVMVDVHAQVFHWIVLGINQLERVMATAHCWKQMDGSVFWCL